MPPALGRSKLAVVILTKNEERDLPGCLDSVKDIANEILVVDSWSTDRTVEIAEAAGAKVYQRNFVNQAEQFNWAIDTIEIHSEWIFRIDADERVSGLLAENLVNSICRVGPETTGFIVPLRIRFLGRDLRFGDTYPVWLLRVFRRGFGRYEQRAMDEKVMLSKGKAQRLSGDLIHDIPKSLKMWVHKHVDYAERECIAVSDDGGQVAGGDYGDAKARSRRRKKELFYARVPTFWRAFLYWAYRYFLKLGLLDGVEGAIYHFIQALWYRFLVDALMREKRNQMRAAGRD